MSHNLICYLFIKMCHLYVGYGEYSADEVTDNFSGEGCHGVLFPACVIMNVVP